MGNSTDKMADTETLNRNSSPSKSGGLESDFDKKQREV